MKKVLTKLTMRLIVVALGLSSLARAAPPGPPIYKTGDQLLAAVNARMREMNHPPFTMDELTVWLARQADSTRFDGQLRMGVRSFLECLVRKKAFKSPVGLITYWGSDVNLTDDSSSTKRLRLPDHYEVSVAIYNMPYGSRNPEGQPYKIVWSTIPLATALDRPVRKAGR